MRLAGDLAADELGRDVSSLDDAHLNWHSYVPLIEKIGATQITQRMLDSD